jgi:hypothetical protein
MKQKQGGIRYFAYIRLYIVKKQNIMKVSVLYKPRRSWAWAVLKNWWFRCIDYNQWDWRITWNMFIDRVPRTELFEEVEKARQEKDDFVLIFWTSINWNKDYFNEVESIIRQKT